MLTDQEYLIKFSNIEIYAQVLLGVLGSIPMSIKDGPELQKRLKFNKISDPKKLRCCIDLLEDTQYAILEYRTRGLETDNGGCGEKYLRLYGVLNATYLQMQAVIDLSELFKIHGKKEIQQDLKKTKAIELRNKIGAHSTNYINGESIQEFYKTTQVSITGWGENIHVINDSGIEYVNLLEGVNEFGLKIEFYLERICNKALNSIIDENSVAEKHLINKMNFIKFRNDQERKKHLS